MKVIKKEDISNWQHPLTCHRCKSELMAEGSDIRHKKEKKYGCDPRDPGGSYIDDTYYAVCAVCNNTLPIPENKIPYLLQAKAKERSLPSTGYKD